MITLLLLVVIYGARRGISIATSLLITGVHTTLLLLMLLLMLGELSQINLLLRQLLRSALLCRLVWRRRRRLLLVKALIWIRGESAMSRSTHHWWSEITSGAYS